MFFEYNVNQKLNNGLFWFLEWSGCSKTFFKYLSIASVIFNRIRWVTSQQLSNENNSYQTIQSVVICSMFWEGFSHNCSFYQSCFFITEKSSELFWRFVCFSFCLSICFSFCQWNSELARTVHQTNFVLNFFYLQLIVVAAAVPKSR